MRAQLQVQPPDLQIMWFLSNGQGHCHVDKFHNQIPTLSKHACQM